MNTRTGQGFLAMKLEQLSAKVPARSFVKGCKLLAVVWLLGVYLPLNLLWPNQLPMKSWFVPSLRFADNDYAQYYMAGVVARHNLWAHLYPRYKPECIDSPDRQIWLSTYAQPDPEVLRLAPELSRPCALNAAPPPMALIVLPLGFFSFDTGFRLWMVLLVVCLWAATAISARIYRKLAGGTAYAEGFIFLLGALYSLFPYLNGFANATMLVAALCGLAALSWGPERPLALGSSILLPAIFKGLSVSWCPLLLIKPVKWRTLAFLAAMTVALNGVVVALGGTAAYVDFFNRMLPETLRQPLMLNISLAAMVGKLGHLPPAFLTRGLYLAGVLGVYIAFFRKRERTGPAAMANLCAALVGLLVLFNLFNQLVWGHYGAFLIPFWGWAFWEYTQSSSTGRERLKLLGLAGAMFLPIATVFVGWFLLRKLNVVTALYQGTILGVEFLFITLAFRRLFWPDSAAGDSLAVKALEIPAAAAPAGVTQRSCI